MNRGVEKLYEISRKPSRLIIGLMSGTSLDGLDIALCKIENSGIASRVTLLHFETVPYPAAVKEEIRKVFARATVDFRQLCLLNPRLGRLHAQWIGQCLQKWGVKREAVDLVASHGQTVYHCPQILHRMAAFPNATLQIGDGDHIAVGTGIITISDFRQKHVAAGGEGAPLALYGDYLVFSKPGEDRIMLNMGGIANFTFLPGTGDAKKVFVTDTGPGNTLIDAFAQKYFQQDFDRDALLARQGVVNYDLLKALSTDDFFKASFPRTTGPELFNPAYVQAAQEASHTTGLSAFDLMATLTRFSADTITKAIQQILPEDKNNCRIYMSGGGAYNPLLREWIREGMTGIPLSSTDGLGIAADAKEAVLFAVLANEAVCGEPVNFGKAGMPAVTMGKISFPAYSGI